MVLSRLLVASAFLAACTPRGPEDPTDWYDSGAPLDVEESVEFTTDAYGLPEHEEDGIAAQKDLIFPVADGVTAFAGSDIDNSAVDGCDWEEDADLPVEVEGVVTVTPRFYFKSSGCNNSDEKFYGSYFIEDDTGGIFVLGDSKVAHFDMGDVVRLRLRAVRTTFGLDMVLAHEVLEVRREGRAIHYEDATAPFDADSIARVHRVEGEVVVPPDTFGEFQVEADDGVAYTAQLDSELTKRGLTFDVGQHVSVTGPVLYSYSTYAVIALKKGQITVGN